MPTVFAIFPIAQCPHTADEETGSEREKKNLLVSQGARV